jgi:hypothetical protein
MIATDVNPRSLRCIKHRCWGVMTKLSEPPVGKRDRDLASENQARCSAFRIRSSNAISFSLKRVC